MVAPHDSILIFYEGMLHVGMTDKQIDKWLKYVMDRPANRSVRETIERLAYYHNAHRNRGYRQER